MTCHHGGPAYLHAASAVAAAASIVQILRNMDAPFETVNILENEALRTGMKEYSQWPT
jgi:glutaredoxin-related protein